MISESDEGQDGLVLTHYILLQSMVVVETGARRHGLHLTNIETKMIKLRVRRLERYFSEYDMQSTSVVARLWDYGWLQHDVLAVPQGLTDKEILDFYVSSRSFHTSYLPSRWDETGIHDPFLAECLSASDFMAMAPNEFEGYLGTIHFADDPNLDEAAAATVLPFLISESGRGSRCFVLSCTEQSNDRFHDWGFVFHIFREFVFIRSEHSQIARYVIGYD